MDRSLDEVISDRQVRQRLATLTSVVRPQAQIVTLVWMSMLSLIREGTHVVAEIVDRTIGRVMA